MVTSLLIATGVLASSAFILLLIRSLAEAPARLWPCPPANSWQAWGTWLLFRVANLAALGVPLLDRGSFHFDHWSHVAIGLPLLAAG